MHEDEASLRLARAVAGDGVELHGPAESQTQLRATRRGLLEVKPDVLQEINCLPDMSVFSSYDGRPVDAGKAVAATKVTPLVVPGSVLEEAEECQRDRVGRRAVDGPADGTIRQQALAHA